MSTPLEMPDDKGLGTIPKLKSKETAAVDTRGYHDYANSKRASYNNSGKGGSGAKGKEADGGAWTTVSHGKGKRGGNPKGKPSSDREAMATPSMSKPTTKVDPALRKAWLREGRCLACGSESHKVRDCALVPPRDTTKTDKESVKDKQPMGSKSSNTKSPKGAKPNAQALRSQPNGAKSTKDNVAKAGDNGDGRGKKRKDPPAPTGATPPAKRSTKQFSYASVTEGSVEMVILTRRNTHIPASAMNELREKVELKWLDQLKNGETLVAVENWSYSTRLATVHLADHGSAAVVNAEAMKLELVLKSRRQYEEERKPYTILTGLVTGAAAAREREILERMIQAEKDRVKIPGKLQYHSAHKVASSGNLLLKILVDEDAEPRFKELSYQLRMGASGYVKFEDDRAKRKVDKRSRAKQIEELEAELEAEKNKLEERIKDLDQLKNSDTASVASMGLSGLNVGDNDKVPDDMEVDKLLARDEDEASPKPNEQKEVEDM